LIERENEAGQEDSDEHDSEDEVAMQDSDDEEVNEDQVKLQYFFLIEGVRNVRALDVSKGQYFFRWSVRSYNLVYVSYSNDF
jgi:hypothetical protein